MSWQHISQSSVLEWYVAGQFLGAVHQLPDPHVKRNISWAYCCPICATMWAKAARLRQDNTYAPFSFYRACCPEHRESKYLDVPGALSEVCSLDDLSPGAIQWEFLAWLNEYERNPLDE